MNVRWEAGWLVVAALAIAWPAGGQEMILVDEREVLVWKPSGDSTGRQPVIIFSHGFGGCATQSRFLTSGLAKAGYWVFAPNHKDARCNVRGGVPARPETPFKEPENWTDQNYRDRADDVRAVRSLLASSRAYASRLDLSRLGLVGHSLGGYTMLGVAGAWGSWKQGGARAVLALSPYAEPYRIKGTLGAVAAPVMYQGGTLDKGITPSLQKEGGVYDRSPAPKYFVNLTGANHFSWTNLRPAAHRLILDYSIAFLDHYVRGEPSGEALTTAKRGVAELRYESELGQGTAKPVARRQ
jgi:predicted dienelactone hydrolase